MNWSGDSEKTTIMSIGTHLMVMNTFAHGPMGILVTTTTTLEKVGCATKLLK